MNKPSDWTRNKGSDTGITAKLITLVGWVFVPLILLNLIFVVVNYRHGRHMQSAENRLFADTISQSFLTHVDTIWDAQLETGMYIALNQPTLEEADLLLRESLLSLPGVEALCLLDSTGNVLSTTYPWRGTLFLGDREYTKEIIAGKDRVLSGLITNRFNRKTKEPVFVVASGIRKNDVLQNIILAIVSPDWLSAVMPSSSIITRVFGLYDQTGTLIYRNGIPSQALRQNSDLSNFGLGRLEEGASYRTLRAFFNNEPYVGHFSQVGNTGWMSFSGEPLYSVSSPNIRGPIINLLALAFVAMLALFRVKTLANDILDRLRKLTLAARQLSEGKMEARADLQGSDELAVAGATFDKMAARIMELEAERTQVLQVAAHELRNPMAGIKAVGSLIQTKIERGEDLTSLNPLTGLLIREIDRLATLITEIFGAFSAQFHMVDEHLEPLNPIQVLRHSIELVRLASSHREFAAKLPPTTDIQICGNPQKLEQMFLNLLSNAVKYAAENSPILVECNQIDGNFVVSISNEGIGIPANQLSSIFQPFYRGRNVDMALRGGMGLGLHVCAQIVEQHGGRIWAESVEGERTTFHVELPLADPHSNRDSDPGRRVGA